MYKRPQPKNHTINIHNLVETVNISNTTDVKQFEEQLIESLIKVVNSSNPTADSGASKSQRCQLDGKIQTICEKDITTLFCRVAKIVSNLKADEELHVNYVAGIMITKTF